MKGGVTLPPGKFDRDDMYRKAWRHAQHLVSRFWKTWVKLYLPSLQVRGKWRAERDAVAKGDLVLILDSNTPRQLWPLAIITDVTPSRTDNLIRSVLVKTRTSVLRRPITQLVLLEANTREPDNSPKLKFKNMNK